MHRRLERAGHSADTAFHTLGQQLHQQIRQFVGVTQPFIVAPVGKINFLLDPRAVEGPVGKPVDGEDVKLVASQEFAELGKCVAAAQFARRAGRQAQPDPKQRVRRYAIAHRGKITFDVRADLGPRFSRVDVAAIGQMRPVRANLHCPVSFRRSHVMACRISSLSMACTSSPWPMSRNSVMVNSPPRCSRNSSMPRMITRRPCSSRVSIAGCHR